MRRCPCCSARLTAEPLCPRCGADLGRVLRCEKLAQAWLSVALQTLNAGQADIAVAALQRSLSFKQTQAARLVRGFLVRGQYQRLYEHIARRQWLAARQSIARLRVLLGEQEALRRFQDLIEHAEA